MSIANKPIKSLGDICDITQFKELEISGTLTKDISPLQYTSKLEVFASYDNEITDFSVLSRLTNLKELYITQVMSDQDRVTVGLLDRLEVLSLEVNLGHLIFLKILHDLKELHMMGKSINLKA